MADQTAQWHWGEGMKYAIEGIKLFFIPNGASAVSLLTFIGNTKAHSQQLVWSMLFFEVSAVCMVIAMMLGYLTQLSYGNAGQVSVAATSSAAWRYHRSAYLSVAIGGIFHLAAVIFAVCGLL